MKMVAAALNWATERAAAAPPFLKTKAFVFVAAKLARHASVKSVSSNFGIDAHLKMHVPTQSVLLTFGLPRNNWTERSALGILRAVATRISAFVDVGANHGLYTVAMAHEARSDVTLHAIEADPKICANLASNLAANNINAEVSNLAAAATSGEITFYRNLDADDMGTTNPDFVETDHVEEVKVPATTLGAFLVDRDISNALLKIDVEGAGVEVWTGLKDEVDRVDWLLFEIVRPETLAGLPKTIINDSGLHAYYLHDFELQHSRIGKYTYVEPFWNWLFCRYAPEELAAILEPFGFSVRVDTND